VKNFNLAALAVLALSLASMAIAGDAVELARGVSPQQPQQPQVAVDSKGAIHVIFGVSDSIFYRRSDDAGKTFTDPILLAQVNAMSLGMRRGPRIAVTGSAICVTAIGGKQGKGRDGDLLSLVSTDGGKTWSEPVIVNDTADAAREGLHAMASGPKNSLCCVWLDLRTKASEVMASTSTDGGKTWSKNTTVYRSPDGSVCECCHPSVAIDPKGGVVVQWRNSLSGARDLYVASSGDGGKTFGDATKLDKVTWPLDGCPMDGGAVATLTDGSFASVWRREKSVFLLTKGQSEERRLGEGEQPWVAGTVNGPFAVWVKKRGGAVLLLRPDPDVVIELAAHGNDPVIACGPSGRGPIVAVWEKREEKNYTIECQVVENLK
jgi:hypothetical protein